MNLVDRQCPNEKCDNDTSDILGAVIIGNDSFTHARCPKCGIGYMVPRKGNKEEQKLTRQFIDDSKIELD